MKPLTSLICRILFVLSFVLAGLAVWEKLANAVGYTVLRSALAPGRLLEISAMSLLFVVALLLREINHSLKGKGPA
jgi:hypothetical protein